MAAGPRLRCRPCRWCAGWRPGLEAEPQGQLGLVLRLVGLAVHHVLVELLAPQGELVAALLEALVDPHQVGQQLALGVR